MSESAQPKPHGAQAITTQTTHEAQQSREFFEMLHSLRLSYTQEVVAKIGRLNTLIGTAHSYTVGTYKEHVIRDQIRAITPDKFSVSTGFVVGQRNGKIVRSNQIDILVWDSRNYAPVIQVGELVIIQPQALRAAIEVKGMLDHTELQDALRNLESLKPFLEEMMKFHPHLSHDRFPFVRFLVACDLDVHKSGKHKGKPKLKFPDAIWNKLRATYRDEVIEGRLKWSAPWGDYAAMAWVNGIAVVGYGYMGASVYTAAGKPAFVSYTLLNRVEKDVEEDQSIGLLRAHLQTALTHPKHYSYTIGQRIYINAPQMPLPYQAGLAAGLTQAYEARKPTSKGKKRSNRTKAKEVNSH